jgi:hypothetical protein
MLAMGIPTTADDSGYFLWFSHHWTDCIVVALAFGTLLIVWVARKIRTWTTPKPGSSGPPGAQSRTMELPDRPSPPPGRDEDGTTWPFELRYYP